MIDPNAPLTPRMVLQLWRLTPWAVRRVALACGLASMFVMFVTLYLFPKAWPVGVVLGLAGPLWLLIKEIERLRQEREKVKKENKNG